MRSRPLCTILTFIQLSYPFRSHFNCVSKGRGAERSTRRGAGRVARGVRGGLREGVRRGRGEGARGVRKKECGRAQFALLRKKKKGAIVRALYVISQNFVSISLPKTHTAFQRGGVR
jgi:hypothetical protein